MTQPPSFIFDLLNDCRALQDEATARWHAEAPAAADPDFGEAVAASPALLRELTLAQHLRNFQLWHMEDEARRLDVGDKVIADCKRGIDALNQERNDRIEKIDACLIALLRPSLPTVAGQAGEKPAAKPVHNTETPGMAIDRLSIMSLKIWHMEEQTRRENASISHIASATAKLAVLREQRADLAEALACLLGEFLDGSKEPKVYFQFKMYNDPNLNPKLYGQ